MEPTAKIPDEAFLLKLDKEIREEAKEAHVRAVYCRFDKAWSLMEVKKVLLHYNYNVEEGMRALLFRGEWKSGKLITVNNAVREANLEKLRRDLGWIVGSTPEDSILRQRLSNCGSVEIAIRSFVFGHNQSLDEIFSCKDPNPIYHNKFAQATFLSSTPITSWPTFQLPLQFPPGMISLLPTLVKYMEERDKALHQPPPLTPSPPPVQLLLPF